MTRDEWLAARRAGVTATDAAAIAGLSPWRTALDVYLDKKGLLPETPQSPEASWGLRLEPAIAAAYEERFDCRLTSPGLVRSATCDHLLATPDRIREDGRLVELKTARSAAGWGDPGTSDIPEPYMLQVQHQMLVTGAVVADVATLIGGSDFRVYHIEAHGELQALLAEFAASFWGRVQRDEPPEPDWSHPSTPRLVKAMFGLGGSTALGPEALEWVAEYRRQKCAETEAAAKAEQAKARLLYAMGEAADATLPGGGRLKRRVVQRREYTVAASSYVTLTIKDPKETP